MSTSDEVEFVITVPEPYGDELAYQAGARTTIGVLTLLIARAQSSLVMAAPFVQEEGAFGQGRLLEPLLAALDRGVDVSIISTSKNIRRLTQSDWAQRSSKLNFYCPDEDLVGEGQLGFHAKFCISDESEAYVGSANLTGAGLSVHLEMGLLVRGRIAKQIADFWRLVTKQGFFVRM